MAGVSTFTQEIADRICERISDGEDLRAICTDADMPGRSTVFRWLAANEDFAKQYALARELQGDALADDMLGVARKSAKTKTEVAARRLLLDTMKWRAAKLRPKVYGDKLELGGTGAGGALLIGISTDPKPAGDGA